MAQRSPRFKSADNVKAVDATVDDAVTVNASSPIADSFGDLVDMVSLEVQQGDAVYTIDQYLATELTVVESPIAAGSSVEGDIVDVINSASDLAAADVHANDVSTLDQILDRWRRLGYIEPQLGCPNR